MPVNLPPFSCPLETVKALPGSAVTDGKLRISMGFVRRPSGGHYPLNARIDKPGPGLSIEPFPMSFLLGLLNLVLILTSVSLVLVVLMQKTKDGGMGAALGGGATESAFGHETGNVLSKFTINAAIVFFVLSFVLYLGRIYQHKNPAFDSDILPPKMSVPATVPLTPSPLSLPGAGSSPAVAPAPAAAGAQTVPGPAATGTVPATTAPAAPPPAEAPKPATP